jgi:glutaredoxin
MCQITVYTKPACVACTATFRALNNAGIAYDVIDITRDSDARDFVMSLGSKPPSSSPPTPTGQASGPTASKPSPS